MSIKVIEWVFDHSDATHGDRLVLLALADKAHRDGSQAWPSISTLERMTGLSHRTVQRCLRRLENDGAILPDGVRPHGTVVYRIVMDADKSRDDMPPATARTSGGVVIDGEGDISNADRAQMTPEPSIEPSEEPSLTRPSSGAGGASEEFINRFVRLRNDAGLGKPEYETQDMAKDDWRNVLTRLEAAHDDDDLDLALDEAIRRAAMDPAWARTFRGRQAAHAFSDRVEEFLASARAAEQERADLSRLNGLKLAALKRSAA